MKVFLDSNFCITRITDDHNERIVRGSEDYDKLTIYLPLTKKQSYTSIFPVYSVKRADGRCLGEYNTLIYEDTSENDYYGWYGFFDKRDICVKGALEITIGFQLNNSAKKNVAMVTTNIVDAVFVDSDIVLLGITAGTNINISDGGVISVVTSPTFQNLTLTGTVTINNKSLETIIDEEIEEHGDARYLKRTDTISNNEIDALFS